MAIRPQRNVSYSDARYGVIHRSYFVTTGLLHNDDVATAGTHANNQLSFPVKAQIIDFGVQTGSDVDVVMATSDTFELRTIAGAKLATLVFAADTTLSAGHATSAAVETATTIAKNSGLNACVGTNVGVSGSVIYFVDWVQQFDGESTG